MAREAHDYDKLVAVRMDSKTVRVLERIGVELDRSVSWILRQAATEYIERRKSATTQPGNKSAT
jgi:predicted transcriptional regulator